MKWMFGGMAAWWAFMSVVTNSGPALGLAAVCLVCMLLEESRRDL